MFFCHALLQSRSWRLNSEQVGKHGKLMSELWQSEAEEEVVHQFLTQVGGLGAKPCQHVRKARQGLGMSQFASNMLTSNDWMK